MSLKDTINRQPILCRAYHLVIHDSGHLYGLVKEKATKICTKDHCHECADCGYERPMTEFESEIAAELDTLLD